MYFQSTVGIIAGLVGTGQMMMSVPYSSGFGAKQMLWLVNCGMLGLAVAPIGALGGAIAIRAGWYTAGKLFWLICFFVNIVMRFISKDKYMYVNEC